MRGGWLSAAAGLVIAATLVIKLAVLDVAVVEDWRAATRDLGASLARQGYGVTMPSSALPIVAAERAGCRLTARVLDPYGTFRDTELRKLPPGWAVSYGWRRRWQTTLPRLGPLSEYYVAREMARIGLAANRTPVIMLSILTGCALPAAATLDLRARLQPVKVGN